MKYRIVSILLVLLLVMALFPTFWLTASALSGSGTRNDPYRSEAPRTGSPLSTASTTVMKIKDVTDLLNFLAGTNGYDAEYDLDCSGTVDITDVSELLNILAGH